MKFVFFSIIIFGLVYTSQTMASSQVIGNKTITRITTYQHYAVLTISPALSGAELGEACAGSQDRLVLEFIRSSDAKVQGTDEQFSTVVAARVAKLSKIGFGLAGCRSGNGNNHPLIYRVDM